VLELIARTTRANIRGEDGIFRIGGDEFAVLLIEVHELKIASAIAQRLRENLLSTMHKWNYPVTFSFGMVVLSSLPDSGEDVISMADALMYEVKRSGKDSIKHVVYDGKK
jgi:diguanylate cyclase (GGDEF)-like protein